VLCFHNQPQMNYQYKHLVGAMIVAGWDEQEGGQVCICFMSVIWLSTDGVLWVACA